MQANNTTKIFIENVPWDQNAVTYLDYNIVATNQGYKGGSMKYVQSTKYPGSLLCTIIIPSTGNVDVVKKAIESYNNNFTYNIVVDKVESAAPVIPVDNKNNELFVHNCTKPTKEIIKQLAPYKVTKNNTFILGGGIKCMRIKFDTVENATAAMKFMNENKTCGPDSTVSYPSDEIPTRTLRAKNYKSVPNCNVVNKLFDDYKAEDIRYYVATGETKPSCKILFKSVEDSKKALQYLRNINAFGKCKLGYFSVQSMSRSPSRSRSNSPATVKRTSKLMVKGSDDITVWNKLASYGLISVKEKTSKAGNTYLCAEFSSYLKAEEALNAIETQKVLGNDAYTEYYYGK